MSFSVQNFRSSVAGETPDGLLPGQIAFNLADSVLFLGNGGDERIGLNGNPVLPAPEPGKGWKAYPLLDQGGTITSVTGASPIVSSGGVNPQISISAASTTAPGAVQLTDSTTTTSSSLALTAAGAANLQNQISALALSNNLTFAGTLNGSTGAVVEPSIEGEAKGFIAGSPMPAAAPSNSEYFTIVTVSGTMTPPGGAPTSVSPGDWWLSTGTQYALIDGGYDAPSVTSITAGTGLTGGTITSTGTIGLANTAVTPGAYSLSNIVVDAQGRITSASSGNAVATVTGTSPINVTTGASPVVSVNAASISAPGVVQLNDTLASTSTTQALTAAQGKALQDQINSLSSASNLTLAGTFDATAGVLLTVTAEGTAQSFVVGSDIPSPAVGNNNYFVIVTTGGSYSPPGGGGPFTTSQGDWLLSNGTAWQFLNVGPTAEGVTSVTAGTGLTGGTITSIGTVALANASPSVIGGVYGCTLSAGTTATALGCGALAASPTGNWNVALGAFTGKSLTSGQWNTFVGYASGCSATTAFGSTFIGINAGGNTNASGSVFIGNSVGFSGGSNNVAVGNGSFVQATSAAQFNATFGVSAGNGITTGNGNALFGTCAGYSQTTAQQNTFLGFCAGYAATGSNNVAIGSGVALPIVGGSCQLAIGFSSACNWLTGDCTKAIRPGAGVIDCAGSCGTAGQVLASNGANAVCWQTPGAVAATPTVIGSVYGCSNNSNSNVFLGYNAGKSIGGGGNNTFIGQNAGCSQSGGFSNIAIGFNAGCSHTSGNNTFIGVNAGKSVTSGSYNVLIGEPAGCSLTTGCSNTHIGFGVAVSDVGCFNTYIGNSAGKCSTSGCYNVALGESTYAQLSASTGSGVTALGQGALRNTSGTGGSNSVAIGVNAGCGNTAGTCNVFVGAASGSNLTTGNCNVAIGSFVALPSATGSCQLAIGNSSSYWLTGDSNYNIQPGAGVLDCTGSVGANGQVLVSTGSKVQWKNAPGSPVIRSTSNSVTTAPVAYDPVTVVYNTAINDATSFYNGTTGVFTPTVAGYYQINASARTYVATNQESGIQFTCNGTRIGYNGSVGMVNAALSTLVYMNGTTDALCVQIIAGVTNCAVPQSSSTRFSALLALPA